MSKIDKRKGRKTVRARLAAQSDVTIPTYSIEDAISIFIGVKKAENLKQKTLEGYESNLRYFMEWMNDNYPDASINDVTINILREYIMWCANEKEYYKGHPFKSDLDKQRRGLSPASINVRIRTLKTFFSTLKEEEIISRNPTDNLSLMKVDIDSVQPLTEDEIRRLLAAPDQSFYAQFRDYCILVLMLDTGMRLNEICSLEIKDVDLRARQIILPAKKNKNRKPRVLPISNETVRLLLQLITESRQYFDSDYVFNTYYGEPINEKTIQKAINKYAEKAGIEKRVSPHVIRHNFAKMAALNGMDIFSLMRMMGHADISTTRRYVQINDDDIKIQHAQFSPLSRILKRKK